MFFYGRRLGGFPFCWENGSKQFCIWKENIYFCKTCSFAYVKTIPKSHNCLVHFWTHEFFGDMLDLQSFPLWKTKCFAQVNVFPWCETIYFVQNIYFCIWQAICFHSSIWVWFFQAMVCFCFVLFCFVSWRPIGSVMFGATFIMVTRFGLP